MGAQPQTRALDLRVVELASRQHGVVTRAQLLGLGLGRRAIGHRLACGRLHPVHRGVYALGRPGLTREGVWLAAVLSWGPGAVLSHRAAAARWEIWPFGSPDPEVTIGRSMRRRSGIGLHYSKLPPDEVTVVKGIPVTIVARTIFDLAASEGERHIARVMREADVRRLWGQLSILDMLARHPGRRGASVNRR